MKMLEGKLPTLTIFGVKGDDMNRFYGPYETNEFNSKILVLIFLKKIKKFY